MNSRRPLKIRRKESDDSSDEDDDRPLYFCPGEGLDIEVVALYVRGLVNRYADIKPGFRKEAGLPCRIDESSSADGGV